MPLRGGDHRPTSRSETTTDGEKAYLRAHPNRTEDIRHHQAEDEERGAARAQCSTAAIRGLTTTAF